MLNQDLGLLFLEFLQLLDRVGEVYFGIAPRNPQMNPFGLLSSLFGGEPGGAPGGAGPGGMGGLGGLLGMFGNPGQTQGGGRRLPATSQPQQPRSSASTSSVTQNIVSSNPDLD